MEGTCINDGTHATFGIIAIGLEIIYQKLIKTYASYMEHICTTNRGGFNKYIFGNGYEDGKKDVIDFIHDTD